MSDAIVPARQRLDAAALGREARIADLVFIRIPALPFRKVAAVTGSWTNHVGIIIDRDQRGPVVAESRFPLSRLSSLDEFIARSEGRQVAIARLNDALSRDQQERLRTAAKNRLGVLYDTGFDLHSPRQFCSRYVREVVQEATGTTLGEIVSFSSLFEKRPDSDLRFWLFWFFGRIPWDRKTVSPASLLASPSLTTLFHGSAVSS